MPTVLVTGFEPFAGEPVNPSGELVRQLDGTTIEGRRVVGVVLPCTFAGAIPALEAAIAEHQPELVVATGQAGGRPAITVERVAINVVDARIADNAGAKPVDEPIVPAGPAAYWSSLPVKAITRALTDASIPADVSQTAGTFVCNQVFYGLMHTLVGKRVRGGFVHVPFLPEQAARAGGAPAMSLEVMVRAIEIVITTALRTDVDEKHALGATH